MREKKKQKIEKRKKKMKMKPAEIVLIVGLIVLSFSTPVTPAVPEVADPVLWVVPENPTRWSGLNPDELLNETVVADVTMGTSFSSNVLVLNHAPAQSDNVAKSVYLKFFVKDASNIKNITIGTAKRVQPGSTTIDPNPNSTAVVQTKIFEPVAKNPPVPAGYGANYSIGDIPWHGNQNAVGNPQDDLDTFNPDAGIYIKVPFTINFVEPPEVGFTLYVYAENHLTGKDAAKTAYSHDAGYHQIPEFTTIAVPVAAILGLLLFFNYRKRRNA